MSFSRTDDDFKQAIYGDGEYKLLIVLATTKQLSLHIHKVLVRKFSDAIVEDPSTY